MPKAYLGLGGNIGDVRHNIEEALMLLESKGNLQVTKLSSYYKTAPVGYVDQDWFTNIVVEIETQFLPYDLLKLCNEVEQQLKRVRTIRWGPRTIDIDILLYEGFESKDERLTIPHPRMQERAFVINPLLEIAPELNIDNKSIKEIADQLNHQEITRLTDD